MANTPRRKSDAARRANQVIRTRTVLVMTLLGILTFVVLFFKLYDLLKKNDLPREIFDTAISDRLKSMEK